MNQKYNLKKILFGFSVICSVYLFYLLFVLSSYQIPNSDDYCYLVSLRDNSNRVFKDLFQFSNRTFPGLIISVIFILIPLQFIGYSTVLIFLMTLFASSFYIFPRKSINLGQRIIFMSPFLCGLLYILDDLAVHKEIIFWFYTSILYNSSLLLGFVWLLFLFKKVKKINIIILIFWFLFSILVATFQEQIFFILCSISLLYYILCKVNYSNSRFNLWGRLQVL